MPRNQNHDIADQLDHGERLDCRITAINEDEEAYDVLEVEVGPALRDHSPRSGESPVNDSHEMPPVWLLGEKVIVAEIGMEGGGLTIFGNQSERGWTFWTAGSSMDLDENDDEAGHSWSSEPVSDLDLVLPRDWPLFYPVQIHPEFLGWFRANYEMTRASLLEDQRRSQEKHRHGRWMEILGAPR